jgi:hypothetical protein
MSFRESGWDSNLKQMKESKRQTRSKGGVIVAWGGSQECCGGD